MRKKIVAGNWKMNLNTTEALALFDELAQFPQSDVNVLIFPPAIYLLPFKQRKSGHVKLGIQNFYPAESGAFTGEISIAQAKDCGAEYALIGHSERRAILGESHEFLKHKVDACIAHELIPVFCCGEPMEIREAQKHSDYVKNQLEESFFHLSAENIVKCVVAYEPVWAIGTGLTASTEQAEEMHKEIRSWFSDKYGQEIAQEISILYGGSCNASNAKELFNCANVDGGLIGGASLKSTSFKEIIDSF